MKGDINKYGQFFTEIEMCKWTLDIVNSIKKLEGDILEPSFGTGNFINEMTKYKSLNIEGVEIDKNHFNNYKNDQVLLHNNDFIKFNTNKKYNFIIGNPPYVEICYSYYSKTEQDNIKNDYKKISNGRINLVHIFMKRSIDLLNDDGVIAFLLPSSVLTSPTYKSIRKMIFDNFNIEFLKEDVNFKDVAIKVCLLVIRKSKTNNNYFYINDNNYFIMENYSIFKESKTLKDYNFNVSIGEIVWNQNKDILTDDISENVLLYSSNIEYDNIQIESNRGRKQYIMGKNIKYKNCIIFTRTISKKIKFHFIRDNKRYIFENHILVLTNPSLDLLEQFYKNLKNGLYNELLQSFFNSSNLTKGELLSLPLNI